MLEIYSEGTGMNASKLIRFARHNAIALTALFVALGGTGYAAVSINGSNIKNGSIAGKKLKRHTLTGTQVNVKRLGTVPAATTAKTAALATSANTASNALSLGGVAAGDYLKAGCATGTIDGYAEIRGVSTMPSTYTTSPTYVTDAYDCSGQAVEVRRLGAGVYDIQFPGSPGTLAVASGLACVLGEPLLCEVEDPVTVTSTYITSGTDEGGFQVQIRDSTDGTDTDGGAYIMVP